MRLEFEQDLIPRHVDQMEIEEDEVRRAAFREIDPLPALGSRDQVDARTSLENPLDELPVRDVVLDLEDRPVGYVPTGGSTVVVRRS